MHINLRLLMMLLVWHTTAIARQPASDNLNIPPAKTALLQRLAQSKPDTGRVHILMELVVFHWTKDQNLDSALRYGLPAFELARQLKNEEETGTTAAFVCRIYLRKKEHEKARKLLSQISPPLQAWLLILIGESFLFTPGLKKNDLDSSFRYFSQALKLAQSIGNTHWKHESLIALAKYYNSSDQLQKGKEAFLTIIRDLQQTKEVSKEAHIWSEMGKYTPDTDTTVEFVRWAHRRSLQLYRQLKDTPNIYSELEDIGISHMFHARFDSAKAYYLQALELRKLSHSKKIATDTRVLGWLSFATGNLEEALQWAQITEQNEKELDMHPFATTQILFALVYAEDGQYTKALQYYLDNNYPQKFFNHFIGRKTTELYLILGQPDKALTYFQDFEKRYPATTPQQHQSNAAAWGDIYAALNKPALAERYYKEMIGLEKQVQQYKARDVLPMAVDASGAEAYYKIARFYVQQGQYSTAEPYLDIAARENAFTENHLIFTNHRRDIYWLRYQVDSAAGHHQAALEHYRQYMLLNDSIANAAKIRRLNQLQVQYETKQKETTIQQNGERIKFLEQNDRLQKDNLRQATTIRNIGIGGAMVFLLLAVLFYRQYRQKQRANKLVTAQNGQLQQLVREKEWLLREVHHRVKNNLHTVICLLESQATYLDNDALKAIESSQHRIYAMSLIHQKLYQVEDVKTIEMSQYLPEFIQYLRESFGTSDKVLYRIEIEPLALDVSVAIPLALIVNEAITNAIKYAFPQERRGTIAVSLYHEGSDTILRVTDDGVGFAVTQAGPAQNSLGMELMKGLTKEIRGQIAIESDRGTCITVRFRADPLTYSSLRAGKEDSALAG